MSNIFSIDKLPYNLHSRQSEQLKVLARIIDIKPELVMGGGQLEVDAICAMILYRHLTPKQRIDAMKTIRSVPNKLLMSKLISGVLDTTFINPQYGMWSMSYSELQSDKKIHEFFDNFASYIGVGGSFLGIKDLYTKAQSRGGLGKGGLSLLVIWGVVAFNKKELDKVNKELKNRSVLLKSELH